MTYRNDAKTVAVVCEEGSGPAAERAASRSAAKRAAARVRGSGPVQLSLTHRAGRGAAVAFRADLGVRAGIDLERENAVRPEFARYFLSPAERRAVGNGRTLAELWAIKEAAWKALRLDDTVHFAALELELSDAGEVSALVLHGRRLSAQATLSRPWPGFVLAVVLVGAPA